MTDRQRWIALRNVIIDQSRLHSRAGELALLEVLAEMERLLPFAELIREPT